MIMLSVYFDHEEHGIGDCEIAEWTVAYRDLTKHSDTDFVE